MARDHEPGGAAEWALPGYDLKASKSRLMKQPSKSHGPSPSNMSSRTEPQKQQPRGQTQQGPTSRGVISPRSQTAQVRGIDRPLRAWGSPAVRQITTRHTPNQFFKDSPSKAKWRNGAQPNGVVNLPALFGSLKYEFFGVARTTIYGRSSHASQGRHEVFKEISKKTGAFVKPPAYTDQAIFLWGEPSQIASAKEHLQKIIAKCTTSSIATKKKLEWAKIHAHSVNKEADVELKERREHILQQLRKAPEDPSTFPEQMLFLWPREGPSLVDSLGSQLEALDVIRAKFGCHLFIPKDMPAYICAFGQSWDTMRHIVQCLRTKWSEIIANSNVKSKVYVVEPPAPASMKEAIVMERNKQFGKARLQGSRPKDLERWEIRAALIQSKNNARVLQAIERSLRGVAFVRGHLRMRINLGSFVLDEYRLPKDEKPSYQFEEFREMLLHEQAKGRLIPGLNLGKNELLARCFEATDILEPCDSVTGKLSDAELAFSVNFEFLGSNNALLRLEAEFAKSPGAHEYEITQRRWLSPRKSGHSADHRPPLQIGVIDFERSDWQLEIKSLEFYEASSINAALRSFSHSINFRRTADINDISAKPQRKVVFPASAPVSRFVEKTAIRYRLKNTKYILEIARYDEYSRMTLPGYGGQSPAAITGPISEVPSSSWGASIFDPNWDNLLGQHANIPLGHTARYSPSLNTFFPSIEETTGGKCKGFWELIALVRQVAELLGSTNTAAENGKQRVPKSPSSEKSDEAGTARQKHQQFNNGPQMRVLLDADLGTLF
ncbi:hypothetical protein KXW98_000814 [Aspergillus fumigatus]|uniref:DUF7905 domain-containing protein n=1 Tax=Aspergillus fumigatus TaxID=746128 RepID=A0A229XXF1_ASPFM|nr:hypothetical protein CNMCM8714_008114 [Aspergillus fumigatus]KMK61049.1 hypothetical protein Y699_08199 [Aspergillus fumigatus Z5]KAF4264505.1 hypothetical protein CNMCM8812_003540 [Aspergillus fumigatus]KAF4272345.1 hypothetical protein CNMCM8057_006319 [Aspergillus fumigatus]KAF4292017.1 hypothetical protein CNMCM8686_007969 [Aspergillus fumigatus]